MIRPEINIYKGGLACCLILMIGITAGCATYARNTSAWNSSIIDINSFPPSAQIEIKRLDTGSVRYENTPCKIELDKKSDYLVSIKLAGYKSEDIKISRKINDLFWGNLLLSALNLIDMSTPSHPTTPQDREDTAIRVGIIGILIDGFTGNMWQHYPAYINLDLTKITSLPDTISVNYPITLITDDGKTIKKTVPLVFHKIGKTM